MMRLILSMVKYSRPRFRRFSKIWAVEMITLFFLSFSAHFRSGDVQSCKKTTILVTLLPA